MAKVTENTSEQKVCGSCGEPFGCGAKIEGCWCTDIKLQAETADELKTKYQDCLCPECLSNLVETAKGT